jgi:hypothetical protein
MQPGHPNQPISDPLLANTLPLAAMTHTSWVALGPIDPDQQHRRLLLHSTSAFGLEEDSGDLLSFHSWGDARCAVKPQVTALRFCHPDSENSIRQVG